MFSVHWSSSALDDLATLWTDLDSAKRQSITAATSEIDLILRIDPESAGESRDEPRRILFVPPLGVIFEVERLDLRVHVLQVLTFRQSGRGT